MIKMGVIYGVSKLPWFEETLVSALSWKKHMPHIPIELFIDEATFEIVNNVLNLEVYFDFVTIFETENHWRSAKFYALKNSRFERTLFLDSDTLIIDSMDEIFELLDKFDLGATLTSMPRIKDAAYSGLEALHPHVPLSFQEYNSGVIIYNNNDSVQALFNEWNALFEKGYKECNMRLDQPSFRLTLYHSDLRIATLPIEYNFRPHMHALLRTKVKVVHAHGELAQIARLANINEDKSRLWTPKLALLDGFSPKGVKQDASFSDQENEVFLERLVKTLKRLHR